MLIIMIGVLHDSTSCHKKATEIFSELKTTHPSPKFIAVEHDKDIFETKIVPLRSAKSHCKEFNKEFSRIISDDEIDIIAQSIGFDGDVHKESFGDSNVVWLDEGRKMEIDIFKRPCGSLIYNRLVRFMIHARAGRLPAQGADRIAEYERLEDAIATKLYNSERDARWLEILKPHLTDGEEDYAFIVVGGMHTETTSGVIRELLEKENHTIQVIPTYG